MIPIQLVRIMKLRVFYVHDMSEHYIARMGILGSGIILYAWHKGKPVLAITTCAM
jgi:hypothetical protein